MLDTPKKDSKSGQPVVVKKYANRRLYNTETSTYVTLEDLAAMVRSDRDFVVFDAKSGDDLTHSVLTQIIVEQESRGSGPNLLPTPFLRQLIRFYDDIGVSPMVPSFLQMSLETLAREQERIRSQMTASWGPAASFEAYNEQVRKNMALFEQAMRMWQHPTAPGTEPATVSGETATGDDAQSQAAAAREGGPSSEPVEAAPQKSNSDLTDLREQLADMQRKIEQLARAKPAS
jgi:polyhydroxyalkanoate synthesis repressor PhaR